MKKLTLKLSALLLCLFCLFGAVACGQDSPGTNGISQSNSASEAAPKVGDAVKIEYFSIDTIVYANLDVVNIRFIPKYDISDLIIIIKAYNDNDVLLEQKTANIGNLIGMQEFVHKYIMTETAFNVGKKISYIEISIKSGIISGI